MARPERPGETSWGIALPGRSRLVFLPLVVLVLAGPILGFVAFRTTADRVKAEDLARFEDYLTERVDRLDGRLFGIGEVLFAIRALYRSSEVVTGEEFATYTRDLLERYPSIQALEWAPRIMAAERAAHEAEVRADGPADYAIRQHDRSDAMVAAEERSEYVPVRFVEPLAGNECAMGFDLASDDVRRETLARAAGSSSVAFSGPIRLVQDERSSPAFLAAIAIRCTDPTVASGVRSGFGVAVFRARELVATPLGPLSGPTPLRMEFMLTDSGPDGSPVVLARYPEAAPPGPWEVSRPIVAGGRTWRLHARPAAGFAGPDRRRYPLVVGGAVLLCWELLFGFLFFVARRSHDRSFRREAGVVHRVLSALQEGVVVADREGRFLVFNEAANRMVGRGARSVPPSDWSATYGCFLPDGETAYPPDDLPLARAIRGERTTDQVLFVRHAERPEGAWLLIDGQPLLDARGEVSGGVIVIRDITERRKTEESVRRLSNAVEQTADVVFITTRDGRIEYVNPAFETVLGYTREEVLGQNPRIFKSGTHGPDYYRLLWETILSGKVHRSTTVNRRKSGELVHTEQTITPMKDTGGRVTHFVSVLKDMTERRKREGQEAELRLAAAIQKNLYPARSPRVDGMDIAGMVLPAEATSGDYYDYLRTADGCLSLVIGDVSGHGLGPALLMAETRAYLRSLIHDHADPCQLLLRLNRTLADDVEPGQFVSLLVARIDPHKRLLTWANAGHVPASVLDGAGAVRKTLDVSGPALGLFPDATFNTHPPIHLRAGDVIVLLTDGVTETRAPDGTFFEEERLLGVVRELVHEPARKIVEGITRSASLFGREAARQDDCTVVVCRMTADDAAERVGDRPSESAARG